MRVSIPGGQVLLARLETMDVLNGWAVDVDTTVGAMRQVSALIERLGGEFVPQDVGGRTEPETAIDVELTFRTDGPTVTVTVAVRGPRGQVTSAGFTITPEQPVPLPAPEPEHLGSLIGP